MDDLDAKEFHCLSNTYIVSNEAATYTNNKQKC